MLADRGYAVEYLFEFLDEEGFRVRSLGSAEIASGRIRTILDGQPSEMEIHLRGEAMSLIAIARPRTPNAQGSVAKEVGGGEWNARGYLEGARRHFGPTTITAPLPTVRDIT